MEKIILNKGTVLDVVPMGVKSYEGRLHIRCMPAVQETVEALRDPEETKTIALVSEGTDILRVYEGYTEVEDMHQDTQTISAGGEQKSVEVIDAVLRLK